MPDQRIEQLEAQNAMMREALEELVRRKLHLPLMDHAVTPVLHPTDDTLPNCICKTCEWIRDSIDIATQALTSSPSDYRARVEKEALEKAVKAVEDEPEWDDEENCPPDLLELAAQEPMLAIQGSAHITKRCIISRIRSLIPNKEASNETEPAPNPTAVPNTAEAPPADAGH